MSDMVGQSPLPNPPLSLTEKVRHGSALPWLTSSPAPGAASPPDEKLTDIHPHHPVCELV